MISVIIPVYNVEEYLYDCLLSVLHQSFSDFEIICVEDCSTDSSLEVLENIAKLDDRIKIIRNEVNSSLGYSRNRGLKYAKGKYVLFLDSDDWLDFKALEILYNTAEKDNLDVLIFKATNYDDKEKLFYDDAYYTMEMMDPYLNKVFDHTDLDSRQILGMAVSAWNKFYLKSFLIENNLKFPARLIHEDNPFFYEMLYKANRISIIDNYFYNRRRRLNSITTRNGKEVLDVIQIIEYSFQIALDNNDVYEKHKKSILNKVFYKFTAKYEFIDDDYKEEFLDKTRDLLLKLFSKYDYLEKDIVENLNEKNLKFYKFLNIK